MERNNRTPILEPLLLITKQRTGMATIISIILSLVLSYFDVEAEIILLVASSIMFYVGKQGWVDSKESAGTVLSFTKEIDFKREPKNAISTDTGGV